ncbi:unnamed protein product, partial [Didymodactylos carnosus]
VQMDHTSPLQHQQYNNENQILATTTSHIQQQQPQLSNNNILSPSNNNSNDILSSHIPTASNQSISSQQTTPQTPNNNQWRHKLNNLKQSFQRIVVESDSSHSTQTSPPQHGVTPEATKKSLFHHIIDAMQEDHHMIVVKDRPLATIKTDLIHAFLSTPDLVHNVLSGTQFRCEYRRLDRSSMFQRNIRFHVEICTVKANDVLTNDSYYVTFTLITEQARRFKKLCEEIQVLFLTNKERLIKQQQRRPVDKDHIAGGHLNNTNLPVTTTISANTTTTTSTTTTNR